MGETVKAQDTLHVFREACGSYELVGGLFVTEDGTRFMYDEAYRRSPNAAPISHSLPLDKQLFSERECSPFFEGLLPEGPMRSFFSQAIRSDTSNFASLLSRLNNESVGAIVLARPSEDPSTSKSYRPLSPEALVSFAEKPVERAAEFGLGSRLSLAGAQSKIGLHRETSASDDLMEGWLQPLGSAPSTYIVKAGSAALPNQALNEAFCLSVAKQCGFETVDCFLAPIPNHPPLLCIRRFDRDLEPSTMPRRLHQEDFAQALGLPSFLKYQPTGANYVNAVAHVIAETSENAFGDRMEFFQQTLFNFIIGNCDNHLKNHSLLYSPDWSGCTLSPLYDVTCTTMYPFDREMGIALCESRKIDDVRWSDIESSARSAGINARMAISFWEDLTDRIDDALDCAEDALAKQGFDNVAPLAAFIRSDVSRRIAACKRP